MLQFCRYQIKDDRSSCEIRKASRLGSHPVARLFVVHTFWHRIRRRWRRRWIVVMLGLFFWEVRVRVWSTATDHVEVGTCEPSTPTKWIMFWDALNSWGRECQNHRNDDMYGYRMMHFKFGMWNFWKIKLQSPASSDVVRFVPSSLAMTRCSLPGAFYVFFIVHCASHFANFLDPMFNVVVEIGDRIIWYFVSHTCIFHFIGGDYVRRTDEIGFPFNLRKSRKYPKRYHIPHWTNIPN